MRRRLFRAVSPRSPSTRSSPCGPDGDPAALEPLPDGVRVERFLSQARAVERLLADERLRARAAGVAAEIAAMPDAASPVGLLEAVARP